MGGEKNTHEGGLSDGHFSINTVFQQAEVDLNLTLAEAVRL